MMTGSIGQIAGCQVIVSRKVKDLGSGVYANVILKSGALALYMKRDVNVESDRDISAIINLLENRRKIRRVLKNDVVIMECSY